MVRYREASRHDNDGLLSLTAMTPMMGNISIRTDRHPDFFRLLERRGASHVLVAEENGDIVGCVSASRISAYVDDKNEFIHYLGDLKVHPNHRKSGLAVHLLKSMHHDLLAGDADLIISTAAYGNAEVQPFFHGRMGFPRAVPLGIFKVYQIFPSRSLRRSREYEIGEESEIPEMLHLYSNHYRRYQFGPEFGPEALNDSQHYVARSNGEFRAAISLVDTWDSQQNVIIALPKFLGSAVSLLRTIGRFIPVTDLPVINSPIRILYIKAIACLKGHEKALGYLIQKARNLAYNKHYHFLTIGLHETDPAGLLLAGFPKFIFKSVGFVMGLKRNADALTQLKKRVPYEDYSLV